MHEPAQPITILIADDDDDDRLLARQAFEKAGVQADLRLVENGVELMDYLHCRNKYAAPGAAPMPGIILLDLNMPRKNGFEALQEIKTDLAMRHIPIIALTTSSEEEIVMSVYRAGASSYIVKRAIFHELVELAKIMGDYWVNNVKLPIPGAERSP